MRENGDIVVLMSNWLNLGVIESMEVDLYKQQSNMLHEWIQNSSSFGEGEKNKPGMCT